MLPDREKLKEAYRLFERDIRMNKLFERVQKKIASSTAEITVPDDIENRVTEILKAEPELRWDAAVRRILKASDEQKGEQSLRRRGFPDDVVQSEMTALVQAKIGDVAFLDRTAEVAASYRDPERYLKRLSPARAVFASAWLSR